MYIIMRLGIADGSDSVLFDQLLHLFCVDRVPFPECGAGGSNLFPDLDQEIRDAVSRDGFGAGCQDLMARGSFSTPVY